MELQCVSMLAQSEPKGNSLLANALDATNLLIEMNFLDGGGDFRGGLRR